MPFITTSEEGDWADGPAIRHVDESEVDGDHLSSHFPWHIPMHVLEDTPRMRRAAHTLDSRNTHHPFHVIDARVVLSGPAVVNE